jgi:tRNA 5-methylaminomethyl-2-thiouridine biosynthesis bifunctional protein
MSEVVSWDDDGTPRSPRFDDIYRSAAGGLEQAQHVFLDGSGLGAAWAWD